MHRLTVLEVELLRDHLGKKDGRSGGNRSGPINHFCIFGGLEGWSYGEGLS